MKNKIAIQKKKVLNLQKMISFLKFLPYKKMFMPSKKRIISASQAILEATDQFMKKDGNLVLIGEGINDPKGILEQPVIFQKNIVKIGL